MNPFMTIRVAYRDGLRIEDFSQSTNIDPVLKLAFDLVQAGLESKIYEVTAEVENVESEELPTNTIPFVHVIPGE